MQYFHKQESCIQIRRLRQITRIYPYKLQQLSNMIHDDTKYI